MTPSVARPGATAATVAAGCVRLGQLASTTLLGVDFVDGAAGPWTFAGASPTPDLRAGGEAVIDALVRALNAQRTDLRVAA